MKEQPLGQKWSDVDHSTVESGEFVNYLDTVKAVAQKFKRENYLRMEAKEGHHILDVGCGAGDDARALAQMVGNTGRVVGIDNSEAMIAEAKKRTEGLDLPVEFRVGDVHNLDFADNTFDGCRADRVFQHLPNREQALAEMIRVARSGARIVANDTDWGTLLIDAPDKNLTRKIQNHICDKHLNYWSGRQLYRLFRQAGLYDVMGSPQTLILTDYAMTDQIYGLQTALEELQEVGEMTANRAAKWIDQLEESSLAGLFFCAITGFLVSGQKP